MSRFKFLAFLILTTLNINSLRADAAFVDYEITVLATNISNYGGFGEWSFSALYESEQESVLFDTGFHEDTVLHNAKILKKNLKQLILSTSKPFIILGLFLYWGVIIVGTFLQLN